MNGDAPAVLRGVLAQIEAALSERQALLTGSDAATPEAQARIAGVGASLLVLLEELNRLQAPQAALDNQAASPGDLDGAPDVRNTQRDTG